MISDRKNTSRLALNNHAAVFSTLLVVETMEEALYLLLIAHYGEV